MELEIDLGLSKDEYESYRIFQGRIVDEYESMVDDENFIVIDGTQDIEKQQSNVRRHVLRTLKSKNQIQGKILE